MLSAWVPASWFGAVIPMVMSVATACGAVWLLRRWRRAVQRQRETREHPMHETAVEADAFLRELRGVIERRDDGVRLVGVVPGRFKMILEVDGQETPLPIRPMLDCWLDDFGAIAVMLHHIIEEIRAEGLDRPDDFDLAEVASEILPQVRTMDWIRSHSPAFGDGRIVHREIASNLAVCYVIDDSWSMVFVCDAHLRRWGLSEADTFGLARRNLAQRTDQDIAARLGQGQPVVLRSADGYAAARLLLLDVDRAGEDLLVALPDRDVLWIGGESAQPDLTDLMSRTEEECAHAPHPLSSSLYRIAADGLEEVPSSLSRG